MLTSSTHLYERLGGVEEIRYKGNQALWSAPVHMGLLSGRTQAAKFTFNHELLIANFEFFPLPAESGKLKKWLFQRGLPFAPWLYVLPNYGEPPMAMTWKMVLKFCEEMFFGDDLVFFDDSHQWCLTYWHEDRLFWGSRIRE